MEAEASSSHRKHRLSRRESQSSNLESLPHVAENFGKGNSSKRSRSRRSSERGQEERIDHTPNRRTRSSEDAKDISREVVPEAPSTVKDGEHVRRKKKRHRSREITTDYLVETPISAVLHEVKDDIEDDPPTNIHGVQHSSYYGDNDPCILQKGVDCVYVEHYDGFSSVSRDHALADHHAAPFNQNFRWLDGSTASALDIAILAQRVWIPLSDFCHGLLAGITLMQAILVDRLLGFTSEEALLFISFYGKFSLVFTTFFYILISVCLVSIFDRLDVAQGDWPSVIDLLSVRPHFPWLLIPIYVGGLVLSLSAAKGDDWINLYQYNTSKERNLQLNGTDITLSKSELEMLSSWHVLNSLRCACVVVGWLLISTIHPPDLLLRLLVDMVPHQKTNSKRKDIAESAGPH